LFFKIATPQLPTSYVSENAVLRKTHVMPRIFQRRPLTLGSSRRRPGYAFPL
jgi:hypothetical protein